MNRKDSRAAHVAGWTGLTAAGLGAPAYALGSTLLDSGSGLLGATCEVATLWGWSADATSVLCGLTAAVALPLLALNAVAYSALVLLLGDGKRRHRRR
ncbi:hypothetical protein ACQPZF_23455 [Actinosynnema sp. CS-041913]|uniref:hypothetical protein n=1 Tax=Actinosynnema sp. CS-041913 TaxID=3239917 RepID=UPI003D8B0D88